MIQRFRNHDRRRSEQGTILRSGGHGAKKIVIAVTAARSLGLLNGFPQMLTTNGWSVWIVSSAPGAAEAHLVDALPEGVEHVVVPMERSPSVARDCRSLIQWVRVLRKQRPDVVMAGTPKAGLLGMVAAKLTRVPVRIYQVRGLRLETVTGFRWRVLWALERLASSFATSILAISASLADRMAELGIASREKIDVLGSGSSNGVDLSCFGTASASSVAARRQQLAIAHDRPVVGFVGRITPDKGIEDLIAAGRILHDRGVVFQLVVIGGMDGQNSATALMETVVAERIPWVHFLGRQSALHEVYPSFTVLCLPTKREGFGNVVIEAAACGVPAVVTRATGAVDAVQESVTGLVVPIGDPDALAGALQTVLENDEYADELGAAARRRTTREFERSRVQSLVAAYINARHDE